MANAGIIAEWTGVLVDTDGQALPGVPAALQRFAARGIDVVGVDHHGGQGSLPGVIGPFRPPANGSPRFSLPRPGSILAAANERGLDLPTSWVIGTSQGHVVAAAQAGCAGCVLIGSSAPTEDLGIVVAIAANLADAPRVMIPRGGGCWH